MVGAFTLIDVPVRKRATGAQAVKLGDSGETVNLMMELNAIDSVLQRVGARTWEDDQGYFAVEPGPGPGRYGVPRFGDALIVTRDDRRPWSPITAERAWRFIIAKRRESVDQAGPPDPQIESYYGRMKRSLDQAEAALAALSPDARALPACYDGDINRLPEGRIVAPGTGSCVPLVAPDPSFLTPGVPRSAFQVLLVYHVSECEDAVASKRIPPGNLGNCAANLKLLEQMDWGRVRALLR
jgi:hypothetical protein